MSTRRLVPVLCLIVSASYASADNPLVYAGEISVDDSLGYDSPAHGLSYYFDLDRVHVDTDGVYNFEMSSAAELAPWFGVTPDGAFIADNYDGTPFIEEASSTTAGDVISLDLDLTAGVYEVAIGSTYWLEDLTGEGFGGYTMTITGPSGAVVTIVPAPAAGFLLGTGVFAFRRRR